MTPQELKNSILQLAIQGKLVEQRPEEGTGEELYRQIQAEKQKLIREGKRKKEKPLPEIAEDEVPFDIPESWKWVYIGDLFQHNTGKALNGSARNGTPLEYITTSNVYWNRFELSNLKTMHFTENEIEKCTVRKGDLLVLEGGEIGRAAIWDFDFPMRIQNHIHRLRSFFSLVTEYFYYIFYLYKNNGMISGKGIAIQGLSANTLHVLKVPLPPLAEQKRIVAKIEELLPLIDRYEKAWGRLEEFNRRFPADMQKSLLQMAIQGKLVEQRPEEGTGEELYRQIQAEKQRLIKEGKIKKEKPLPDIAEDEVPFEIPESWKWVLLEDLVCKSVKRGKAPSYAEQGRVLVFAQKCNTKKGIIDLSLSLHLDETRLNRYPQEEFLQDKDIVINSTGGGTMGRVGFYQNMDNPSCVPVVPDSHVTIVRVFNEVYANYIFYSLKYYQPYMEKQGTGSTNQTELSATTIRALQIPLPPLAEQKRIVAKLEKLLPLCERLK